jgi:hypothetical protein
MSLRPLPTPRAATVLVLLGTLGGAPWAARAADPVVPPAVQAALTLRILEYDRALQAWASGGLRVGIVAAGGDAAGEYRKGLEGQRVQGLALTTARTAPRDEAGIRQWIQAEGIGLLYVSPDAGSGAAAAIAAASASGVPSLTGTRDHFDAGATLGLVVRDAKPHILVRLPSAKAVGMDLDPKVLKLAEIVG